MRFSLLTAAFAATTTAQDLITALQTQPDLSILYRTLSTLPELAAALNSASNITILAPIDSAFNAVFNAPVNPENFLLQTGDPNATTNLLSYHVLQGAVPSSAIATTPTYVKTLFTGDIPVVGTARTNVTGGQNVGVVNNGTNVLALSGDLQFSTVVEADIKVGDNIIVHKIDSVLSIPNPLTTTGPEVGAEAAVAFVAAAGLGETLDTVPDLTIFVPTNDAFDAIGSILATASIEDVAEILQYHAITGAVVFSGDVTETTVETVQGGELTLSVVDGSIFVNTAKVVIPNIIISNGVVHVIDAVLNPASPSVDRSQLEPSASPSPAFENASSSAIAYSAVPVTTTRSVPAVLTTAPAVASATVASTSEVAASGTTNTGAVASPSTFEGAAPTGQIKAGAAVLAGAVAAAVAIAG